MADQSHVSGKGGKKYTRLLGQCGVIAHRLRVRGPPHIVHISPPNFPFHEITMLRTPRVLHFPTLQFFISHPPPLPDPHAFTLPPKDTSSVTISPGEGSSNFPNASGSGTIRPTTKRRIWSCVSFGDFLFHFISIFLSRTSRFRCLQYMGSCVGKLGSTVKTRINGPCAM